MSNQYTKANPYLARIKERVNFGSEDSQKKTFHVVLDLEGSGITYQVGDSIAIQPTNPEEIVNTMLALLRAEAIEIVHDKLTKEPLLLRTYLERKVNLSEVSKKLIGELAKRQSNQDKKTQLEQLLAEDQKQALKEFQANREVWDILHENEEVVFSPEELCHMLQPLLPRFYSIASSMSTVGNEVHLLVAHLSYETNGNERKGVCTDFLCYRAPLNESVIPIYIQPSHGFTLPESNDAPIIMIGPGTGVAPYRGFMQERVSRKAGGFNWLFFGERYRETGFFYANEWNELLVSERLRLDTAFSRDQEHKIYVQHKMVEQGKEIFRLLEEGAYLYVCGDASRMAKDVDSALHHIVQTHGVTDEAGAKEYVKKMRSSKRYLRDVY